VDAGAAKQRLSPAANRLNLNDAVQPHRYRAGDDLNIFPVVYFAVSRSLLASGQRLAMVARVHGASARAFWHITLPMLSPALAAGMLLAFTLAIEEFGVPAALGTRAGVVMLTTDIEKTGRLAGRSLRGVDAFCCWWLSRCRPGAAKKLTGHHDVTSVTGKPTENSGANAGVFTLPIVMLMALVGGIAVMPGASMALSGLMGTLSGGVMW
jgi:iron(III) transport system permease protein